MKKAILSVFLFLIIGIFARHVQAQTPPQFVVFTSQDQRSAQFGILGGLNIANINNLDNTDSRAGFMLGVYADLPTPYKFASIQPEVLYTQKGFESLNGAITGRFDYIEIPILAKFDLAPNYDVAPNVYLGPYVAFNVNTKINGGTPYPDLTGGVDFKGPAEDADAGVVMGGGLTFARLTIGVRYSAGLTNAFKNNDGKNSVLSIVASTGL